MRREEDVLKAAEGGEMRMGEPMMRLYAESWPEPAVLLQPFVPVIEPPRAETFMERVWRILNTDIRELARLLWRAL